MIMTDAHCHLWDGRYPSPSLIIEEALHHGVATMVNCTTGPNNWHLAIEQHMKWPSVIPFLGIHPWYVEERGNDYLKKLRKLVENNICGIGEIGIDRSVGENSMPLQEKIFIEQLELAKELKRPVSIHCRKTWDRLVYLLKKTKIPGEQCMIHAYSGSLPVTKQLIELGVYFSFAANITNTNTINYQKIIPIIPLNRILTETDSPDIYPAALGGKKAHSLNRPTLVNLVIERMAVILDASTKAIEHHADANLRGFLEKIK